MSFRCDRRVTVAGRSWQSPEPGLYSFEATIDGQPTEIHVSEELAFDFLQAWTPDTAKCLEILRLHRSDLARIVEWKLGRRHRPRPAGGHLVTWRDFHRAVGVSEDAHDAGQPGAVPGLSPA